MTDGRTDGQRRLQYPLRFFKKSVGIIRRRTIYTYVMTYVSSFYSFTNLLIFFV